MRASDITFTINSGDYKGKEYSYTLATIDGKKAWDIQPLFKPAPCMFQNRIEMTITAGEKNVDSAGAIELRNVNKIIAELNRIAEADDPCTLEGLDHKKRFIRINQDGFAVSSTLKEPNRSPEYLIRVTCWGLYDYKGNYGNSYN